MNIIMTGSTSFVGAATVRELLRRGHTVTAIVRPDSSKLDTILEGNEEALLTGHLLDDGKRSFRAGKAFRKSDKAAGCVLPFRLGRIRERVKDGQGASGEEHGDLPGDDSDGDLSENFEYYAAKKDKNKNESRIRYLERMIRTAKVVSDESKDDEVGLYNTVDVYFEDDDETETYKIVTTIRGNSLKGLISSESPLGRALLGHKVGDRVHVQVNDKAGYDVIIKRLGKDGR